MTSRERILAALQMQPVDRIPFSPLIDTYTIMDMPPEVIGESSMPVFNPETHVAAARALGCDIMARHVLSTATSMRGAPHLESLGRFVSPVEASSEFDAGQLVETIATPVGALTGIWQFTDKVGWIPHMVKPPVTNHEELKIFHYAVDHLDSAVPEISYDLFLKIDESIGNDGIATASVSNSPLMYLIEMAWGLENTYYLLQDYPEEVEDILAKLRASLIRHAQALAEGPAEVVIQYENTSSTLLSPDVFRRYCLPCLNECADIVMGAEKIFLVHMCGKLSAFTDDIAGGRFMGICDIPPPPTGDLPLDEAKNRLPEKVVVGGIDPTTFLNHDTRLLKEEITELIERIKPHRGVMLGSADTAPRGTPPENFRLIRELVETVGAYS
jgi:uroporphyrinogen-III decarboxylase